MKFQNGRDKRMTLRGGRGVKIHGIALVIGMFGCNA